ncbi:MAG: EamA family transporter, partial [Myxococcales bacterium]
RDVIPAGPYAAAVYGTSGVVLTLACLALASGGLAFSAPPHSLVAIVALAIIPTLGGHTLVQWSARHVPAAVVALVSPGETIGSLLIGAALLGQAPTRHEAAGAALVLAGVAATLVAQRRGA